MNAFRLSWAKYSRDVTGLGAERSGGRWNSKGTPIIYTSASRALCTAELAVHLPLGVLPVDYQLITFDIPDRLVIALDVTSLSADWNTLPHSDSTQQIGDRFIAEVKALALKVPSAVVRGDFNYLINPKHKSISRVKLLSVEEYTFDKRLFVR